MKRIHLHRLSLLVVVVLFIGIPGYSRAASNLSVSMYSAQGYHVTGDATTDDGGNLDYICVVCLNSDGSPNDVDVLSFPYPGTIDATGGCNHRFPTDIPPYSVSVYDVTGPYSQEDTPGGLAYCQSFAPPSPSSPSGSPSAHAAPVPGSDMIFLPEWAVVGTFTQATLLYYDPAQGATSDSMTGQRTIAVGAGP